MSPAQKAAKTLERYWDNNLPVNPTAIAYNMGVEIVYNPALKDKSGYFEKKDSVPVIHLNPRDTAAKQRFAIFHELGHFVLGHDHKPYDDPEHEYDEDEEAADIFATEMIMPEQAVRFLADKSASVADLAPRFNVSAEAMRIRLENLGLLEA